MFYIEKTKDSGGDDIWLVFKGDENIGMFRDRDEAQAYLTCKQENIPFCAKELSRLNRFMKGAMNRA